MFDVAWIVEEYFELNDVDPIFDDGAVDIEEIEDIEANHELP